MKNIAIIPARSGSKGLKDKNIKNLMGKPLLYYSIAAAKESGIFDEVMVSTDSRIYAEIARDCGASVPFLRSEEKSSDCAGSWDVVKEVLSGYLNDSQRFDTVCLLQPTSPLRTHEDINGAYKLLDEKNADAITSVCMVDHSPVWTMTLNEEGSLSEFRQKVSSVPRQLLDTYYRINGAVYIRKIDYSDSEIILKDDKEFAYIMDRNKSVDIDTIDDFELAEFYLKKNV